MRSGTFIDSLRKPLKKACAKLFIPQKSVMNQRKPDSSVYLSGLVVLRISFCGDLCLCCHDHPHGGDGEAVSARR